jgi:transposase
MEALMETVTTRREAPVTVPALYMAVETGVQKWKVGFTCGAGQQPRIRVVDTGDLAWLGEEIERARRRFGLPTDAPVHSCYEAGRDGFWIHRALERMGVHNRVVDSASIRVERRARRAKSDRLDVVGLLDLVIRRCRGEDRVCRVCVPPSPEDEDLRRLDRELEAATRDRTRSINRIKSFLATEGVYLRGRGLPDDLSEIRTWEGAELPARLRGHIDRERERLQFVERQVRLLKAERKAAMRSDTDPAAVIARKLQRLRAIGPGSGWVLASELFAWRKFDNVRQLGALVGLSPTPYQSGTLRRELGISKAGNAHVRFVLVELAWQWVRLQPESELTLWYRRQFAGGGDVRRKKGIVAVARKLLIALWKYVEYDQLPEGAVLKP